MRSLCRYCLAHPTCQWWQYWCYLSKHMKQTCSQRAMPIWYICRCHHLMSFDHFHFPCWLVYSFSLQHCSEINKWRKYSARYPFQFLLKITIVITDTFCNKYIIFCMGVCCTICKDSLLTIFCVNIKCQSLYRRW